MLRSRRSSWPSALLPDRPSELEVLAGRPFGEADDAPALPAVEADLAPRRALEEAILPALCSPPCCVSFSGGRDSSLVLAVAAHLARTHGLELPVPVTSRFPDHPATKEDGWQELVLAHLGLHTHVVIEVSENLLDLVGPVATSALRRHGVMLPVNVYLHAPLLAEATGGTLLTGWDGDGLFAGWRWQRLASVLQHRSAPTIRDGRDLLYAPLPMPAKRLLARLRHATPSWLTARGAEAVRRVELERWSPQPARWEAWVRWWSRRRYLALGKAGFAALAGDAGTHIRHPLLEGRFVAAMAGAGRMLGVGGRTEAMRHLAGDLLPEAVVTRASKAVFSTAVFGADSRRFAPSAVDAVASELVDGAELAKEWSKPVPVIGSLPLLQKAWLSLQD